MLDRIAHDERSHAEFSWALLEWLVSAHGERVLPTLTGAALRRLARVRRPTAASNAVAALAGAADAEALRRHGRLRDAEWALLWDARLVATRARLASLVSPVAA